LYLNFCLIHLNSNKKGIYVKLKTGYMVPYSKGVVFEMQTLPSPLSPSGHKRSKVSIAPASLTNNFLIQNIFKFGPIIYFCAFQILSK
jgi:hypothetical protein